MSNLKIILVTAFAIVVASCTTTYKAKVDFDRNTNVDTLNYKTFAWLTTGKIMAPAQDVNPVMKLRVDEEVENAFIAKGYKLVTNAEDADFTISYTVGNRDKIKVHSYPSTYGGGFGWGRGYYGGYYGGLYGGLYGGTETHVRQYTEGKLAIDVYDVKTHQPVWHGWATKRLTSDDKEAPSSIIKEVVNEVVAQF
ncbi:MAG: hypothetical protein COB83_05050 [Gammaproteobacteria bacterium]|nr:MAG: hypothetical protein COB83_05050 [Gammaproteobacteria bacterium]